MNDTLDWGDNLVAPFNFYLREVFNATEDIDNFDLDSSIDEHLIRWEALRKAYRESALKLVEVILKNPDELRKQLTAV